MWNFQDIVFIWTQTYREICKSALVYNKIKILEKFYEGLCGASKSFKTTTTKCENKNLSYFFLFFRNWDEKG